MEHRLARRVRVPLDVVLYARGSMVARGLCRDVGLYGLYVQTDPGVLHRNALVEVEILAAGVRLHALVVHCNGEGVGLAFDEATRPEQMARLREFLRALAG